MAKVLRMMALSMICGLLLLCSSAYAQDYVKEGLVSYWRFDEGSGTVVKDSAGKNHGKLVHGATWVEDGRKGRALSFDGTDDYVECGNDASLNFGLGDFTIEAWIKFTTIPANWFGMIYCKGYCREVNQFHFAITGSNYKAKAGKLCFGINKGIRYKHFTVFSGDKLNDGEWHHVSVAVDRDAYATLFIDGQKDASIHIGSISAQSMSNSKTGRIGSISKKHYHFNGVIDEVRIYNRVVLSSGEREMKKAMETLF